MKYFKNWVFGALYTMVVVTLTACGSSGDSGGGGGGGGGITTPTDFYQYYLEDGQSLVYFGTDTPPAPTDVKSYISTNVDTVYPVLSFNANTDNNIFTFAYRRYVLVVEDGGVISLVDTDLAGMSTPVQLSSATNITACTKKLINQRGKVYFFFSRSMNNCASIADTLLVTSDMDSLTPPITVPTIPLAPTYNLGGDINGWLFNEGGVLRRYDANFANGVSVMGSIGASSRAYQASVDKYLLVDVGDIYAYRNGDNVVSASIYSATSTIGSVVNDQSRIYFVDGNNIYSAFISSAIAPTLLTTITGATSSISLLKTTGNAVLVSYTTVNGEYLIAIDKDTGVQTPFENDVANQVMQLRATRNGRVFYNVINNSTTRRAVAVMTDNTGRTEFLDALWVVGVLDSAFSVNEPFIVQEMVLANGLMGGSTLLDGGLFETYDATTLGKITDLGTITSGFTNFTGNGFGDAFVFTGTKPGGNNDTFLFSPYFAGSVTRLTDGSTTTNDVALPY